MGFLRRSHACRTFCVLTALASFGAFPGTGAPRWAVTETEIIPRISPIRVTISAEASLAPADAPRFARHLAQVEDFKRRFEEERIRREQLYVAASGNSRIGAGRSLADLASQPGFEKLSGHDAPVFSEPYVLDGYVFKLRKAAIPVRGVLDGGALGWLFLEFYAGPLEQGP